MKFYPHGGSVNLLSTLRTASFTDSASLLNNIGRPVASASLALSAAAPYIGPIGASGSNVTVTGPIGPSGSTGATGPRGKGSYTGSLTTVTCCTPFDTVCVGVDLYAYDSNCELVLSCTDIVTCGGIYTSCQ